MHVESQSPDAAPEMDREKAQEILDITLRTGALLLASQAGTADVEATMGAIASAYGLPRTHVDVTASTILISIPRGVESAPLTAMWRVQNRATDYTTLNRCLQLAQKVADERPDPAWVHRKLEKLETTPHRYSAWMQAVALGVMAGALAVLLGANAPVALVAAATTMLVSGADRILAHFAIPMLFQRIVGGAIATAIAISLNALGVFAEGSMPSLIVASNIVAQLSGMALVSSVQDAITGFHLTATGRFMEILLSSVGLFIGIGAVVRIGAAFDTGITLNANPPVTWLRTPVRVIAGAVASAAAAVAGYAPPRATVAGAISGAFGATIYFSLLKLYGGSLSAAFIAATAVGLIGSIVARRARLTLLIVAMSGIMPLVPGFTLFSAFVNIVDGHSAQGIEYLVLAAGTALALAAGVVLGPLFAPAFRREARRLRALAIEMGQPGEQRSLSTPVLAGIKVRRRHFEPRPRTSPRKRSARTHRDSRSGARADRRARGHPTHRGPGN